MLPEMFYWLNISEQHFTIFVGLHLLFFAENILWTPRKSNGTMHFSHPLPPPFFFFFFCRFLTLGLQSAMVCPIPMTSAWTACVARLPTFLQSASRRKTGVLTPNMMCTGQWTVKTPKYSFSNPVKWVLFYFFLSMKPLNLVRALVLQCVTFAFVFAKSL